MEFWKNYRLSLGNRHFGFLGKRKKFMYFRIFSISQNLWRVITRWIALQFRRTGKHRLLKSWKLLKQTVSIVWGRKVKSAYEPSGVSGRTLPWLLSWSDQRVFLLLPAPLLMGCWSISGLPPELSSPVLIYIPGWREPLGENSVLPRNTTQCPRQERRTKVSINYMIRGWIWSSCGRQWQIADMA